MYRYNFVNSIFINLLTTVNKKVTLVTSGKLGDGYNNLYFFC